MCKWKTNSSELQNEWMDTEFTEKAVIKNPSTLKVLGIAWRTDKDDFTFEVYELIQFLKNKVNNTKRGVLQSAARLFDPIGFLSPFTIRIKCLFQELWQKGLDWDEELPTDLCEKWRQWCAEIPTLTQLSIQRRYDATLPEGEPEPSVEYKEVHVFCDASKIAYCAAAYLRIVKSDGNDTSSLIAAKTRVAPLKPTTLPRLELLGAVIGARLGNYVLTNLNLDRSQLKLWTDSMITIHWIKSDAKQWKPFVSNRVSEIQGLTLPENWNHCRGRENPADL